MEPLKHDISVWRGATFGFEVISQIKNYAYDPAVNITVGDQKRTYAENLEKYGFVHVFLDFAVVYDRAELVVHKRSGANSSNPLLILDLEGGNISLTNKSVKVIMNGAATQNISFDDAIYELRLTINEIIPADDVGAGAESADQVDILVYGSVTVLGEKNK